MIFFDRISIGMTAKGRHDITGMLAAWNDGSAEVLDRVIDVIYPELRRIARKHLCDERPLHCTLLPHALDLPWPVT